MIFDFRSKNKDVSSNTCDNANKQNKRYDWFFSNIYFLFIPVAMLFMEFVARTSVIGFDLGSEWIYIFILTFAMGGVLSGICGLFRGKGRQIATISVMAALAVLYSFLVGYYHNFTAFFSIEQMAVAGDAITDFFSLIVNAAKNIWYIIIIMFIPMAVFIWQRNRLAPKNSKNILTAIISLLCSATLFFMFVYVVNISGNEIGSVGYTYKYVRNEIEASYKTFGFAGTVFGDTKQSIFGGSDTQLDISPLTPPITTDTNVSPTDKEYGYNVLDIDFNQLAENESNSTISNMHEYVASQTPTSKNEYTGMFEGKNLIMMTLESFHTSVIDPEFTPMLYKMSTEGFIFNNYYQSYWSGSTASGEYSNLTGNAYNLSTALSKSAKTAQPFTMANQLNKLGYQSYAYHDHTNAYYARNLSHPNFGYEFKARYQGLKISALWPESDREMAELTVDEFINDEHFNVYYMTVSGHMKYEFSTNSMCIRHKNDLPDKYKNYPTDLRAYLAGQYEVELMLEYLVQRLDEAGVLDNTVFVMMPDHYPYGLSDEGLSILMNLNKNGIRKNKEIFKNTFIIWTSTMDEPITVDKYCTSIDVLPTLLNLWGLDFDSRILTGKDIFAPDYEGLVILRGYRYTWITNEGYYNGFVYGFHPSATNTMSEEEQKEYSDYMSKIVNNKIDFSFMILDNDYYSYLLDYIP